MSASVATIRAARPEDAAPLANAVATQPLLRRYGITVESLTRGLSGAIASGEVLVEDQLRGFAWFLRQGGFGLGAYLRLIALVPGNESKGLGAALLHAVESAVEARHLFLLVSDFNTAAQRFYERLGYRRSGELPGLVLPDITEVVYWKRLR